jgi:hypothetical protein
MSLDTRPGCCHTDAVSTSSPREVTTCIPVTNKPKCAEGCCAGRGDGRRALIEAAALVADPTVRHLLSMEVVRSLYTRVYSRHVLPREEDAVQFFLRLLTLGGQALAVAAGDGGGLPGPTEGCLGCLLPVLVGVIVDGNAARVRIGGAANRWCMNVSPVPEPCVIALMCVLGGAIVIRHPSP